VDALEPVGPDEPGHIVQAATFQNPCEHAIGVAPEFDGLVVDVPEDPSRAGRNGGHDAGIAARGSEGRGPDLVAEVVSAGAEDKARDHVVKRREYEEAGIPEYWIVDPFEETITVLVLDGPMYRELGVFARGSRATSATLESVFLDVSAVLDAH